MHILSVIINAQINQEKKKILYWNVIRMTLRYCTMWTCSRNWHENEYVYIGHYFSVITTFSPTYQQAKIKKKSSVADGQFRLSSSCL